MKKLVKITNQPIAVYRKGYFGAQTDIGIFAVDELHDRFKVADIIDGQRTAYRWLKCRYDIDGDDYVFTQGERRYLRYFE